VEDDDNKSITEPMLTDEQLETPLPFAHIGASSVKSPSATPSSLFGLSTPSPPSGTYIPDGAAGALVAPTWTSTPSNSTVPTSIPALSSTSNHSALELHRPQSAQNTSPSPPPTQDQIMQAAFQQLIQSPSQVQRLMQLLSSGATNGSTPVSAPMTTPTPPSSWTPPASLDHPQLAQLALYDNSIGGGSNNALTFDNKDVVVPSTTQLAEDEVRLAGTYHDASEIDADVDVLQASINALIENMGLDSAALPTTSSSTSIHPPPPPPPSSGTMPPAQLAADFDFEAFLTAFANEQDNEGGATGVDDRASGSGSACASGPASKTGTDTANEPVQAGRKRTSDAAGALGTDTTAADPPRAKRNKK